MGEKFVRTTDGRIIFQAIVSAATSVNHALSTRMHGYADNGFPVDSPIETNDSNIWNILRAPALAK